MVPPTTPTPRRPGGRSRIRRILFLGFGWTFVVLGVLGLFLPVLQGILFLLVGFTLLSRESRWARRQLDRLKARFPEAARRIGRVERRALAWIGRLAGRDAGRRAPDEPEG